MTPLPHRLTCRSIVSAEDGRQRTYEVGYQDKGLFACGAGADRHVQRRVADRAGLERLCRYGLRSSFSLARLSLRPDGNVCYRLKRRWSDGRTEIVLSPLSLLRRLAWLIPPANAHTVRYHGVFAPAAALRKHLLPRRERRRQSPCATHVVDVAAEPVASDRAGRTARTEATVAAADTVAPGDDDLPPMLAGPSLDASSLLPCRRRRLDWASLLRRTYRVDVLQCPRCDGRMKVVAAISQPSVVAKILAHLGLPCAAPVCTPARAPPELFDFGA